MILCAAVKFELDNGQEVVLPCRRHCEGLILIGQLLGREFHIKHKISQGFIDTKGKYYDRQEAYQHALASGQINNSDGKSHDLFSEDLY